MGKKVDLNAPRNNNNTIQNKSHRVNSTTNNSNTSNNSNIKSSSNSGQPNDLQKKIAAKAMASQGVPEGIANSLLENEKFW